MSPTFSLEITVTAAQSPLIPTLSILTPFPGPSAPGEDFSTDTRDHQITLQYDLVHRVV